MQPFHLAVPVDDLSAARDFYGRVLGCPEGRSSDRWVDFNLYGHQFVVHLVDRGCGRRPPTNPVDGEQVPVPHFGVVLERDAWQDLAERLRGSGVEFAIEPQIRFAGTPSEQATMFFFDPSGNALEFKSMTHPERLFTRDDDQPAY